MARKSLLSALILTFLMFSVAVPAVVAAELKVGYVDLQKCLLQSVKGKKFHDALKAKKDKMQSELDRRQSQLDKTKEELDKQGIMLSPQAKQDKEREFQKDLRDFKLMYNDYSEEMKVDEEKYKSEVFKDLSTIIEKVGKDKGYTLILEKSTSGILWAPKTEELTDEVIKAYDASYTAKPSK